jgi:hypothetical protein
MKYGAFLAGIVLLLTLVITVAPVFVQAESVILVDCKYGHNGDGTPKLPNGEVECGFLDAIAQIKKLINFFFLAALPIIVIAIAWSGIKILLAQGNTSELKNAKELLQKILTGFFFVLVAWLLVHNIASYFLCPKYYTPFIGGGVPIGVDISSCRS